jgi:hypothetical protein
MAHESEGTEKQARSVALPTEEGGEEVIAQQNSGPESEGGSGEWPSPQAAPTGPAPGTTPEGAEAASRRDQAPPQHPPPGASASAGQAQQQDATEAGDQGPARTDVSSATFKDVLDADPVASGSRSAPKDDDPVDPNPS